MSSPTLRYNKPSESSRTNYRPAPAPFNLAQLVRGSTIPRHLHDTICAMLKFNRHGVELWASTESISFVTRGRSKHGCLCRRTVQLHIDEAVKLGVLEEVYPANSRVRYNGTICFRHTATYRLVPEKLTPRKTWEEWQALKPVAMPKPPQRVDAPAAAPVVAIPQKPVPAERPAQPKLTRREAAKLVAEIAIIVRGCTTVTEEFGGYTEKLKPGDPRYQAPMTFAEAFQEVCKRWNRDPVAVNASLMLWGYNNPESDA